MPVTLKAPIAAMLDATNRADTAAFLAAFTADAQITDWGRHYHGHKGIAQWNKTDNIGVQSHLAVLKVKTIPNGQAVTVSVSGNGHNGEGVLQFTVEGDKISRLLIEE